MMKLRNKLDELGKMEGIKTAELEKGSALCDHVIHKSALRLVRTTHMEFLCSSTDPEEFLNMLFKHTLNVEPFIYIKSVLT